MARGAGGGGGGPGRGSGFGGPIHCSRPWAPTLSSTPTARASPVAVSPMKLQASRAKPKSSQLHRLDASDPDSGEFATYEQAAVSALAGRARRQVPGPAARPG